MVDALSMPDKEQIDFSKFIKVFLGRKYAYFDNRLYLITTMTTLPKSVNVLIFNGKLNFPEFMKVIFLN